MNRLSCRVSLGFAAIIGLAAICAEQASAQPPDSLQQLRFIPSRSTLDVTGDFAGVRQQFFTYGKFGLNAGYEGGPHAEFMGVDSWLVPDSALTFVWHTDRILNLSGLEGTFAPSDPSRITFQGVDGQGVPFHVTAVQRGRLLHLVGENDPPCCDFFKYKLNALAHVAPYADFNLDGMVDKLDADILSSNIGTFATRHIRTGRHQRRRRRRWRRLPGLAARNRHGHAAERVRQRIVRGLVAQLQRGAGTNDDRTSICHCYRTALPSATIRRQLRGR